MQIGSLWWIIATYGVWEAFVQGFADGTGRVLGPPDLAAGRAFAHFLVWRYISDYGDWHGEPLDAAKLATEVARAAGHRKAINPDERHPQLGNYHGHNHTSSL